MDLPPPDMWKAGPKTYPSANAQNRTRTGGGGGGMCVAIVYPTKLSVHIYTIDCEIFAVKKISSTTFIFYVTYIDLYLFWSLKSGDEI